MNKKQWDFKEDIQIDIEYLWLNKLLSYKEIVQVLKWHTKKLEKIMQREQQQKDKANG